MAPSAFLCAPQEPHLTSVPADLPESSQHCSRFLLPNVCRCEEAPHPPAALALGLSWWRDVGPAATAYAVSARSDPYWAARAVSSLLAVARLRRGSVKMSHGINRNSKQTCSAAVIRASGCCQPSDGRLASSAIVCQVGVDTAKASFARWQPFSVPMHADVIHEDPPL